MARKHLAARGTSRIGPVFIDPGGTTWDSNGTVADIQSIHNTLAQDGDTITVPPGIHTWDIRLDLTKGITLRGATIISGDHTTPMTANDLTIIRDNTPRSGQTTGVIQATIAPGKPLLRITGLTFEAMSPTQTSPTGDGGIRLNTPAGAVSPNELIRLDHCHFNGWKQGKDVWISGWVYGLADHNIHDTSGNRLSYLVWHRYWNNAINGNGSFNDFPYFGTNKFWFVEDCTLHGNGASQTSCAFDQKMGGRVVSRYNTWINAHISTHGTSGSPQRGVRAIMQYNDKSNWSIGNGAGEMRSGTAILHDNQNTGTRPTNDGILRAGLDRAMGAFDGGFCSADGASVWDQNAGPDGVTPVAAGQPGHIFFSGTAHDSQGTTGTRTVQMVSNPGWTVNQWADYSIHLPGDCTNAGAMIASNTNDTITYDTYGSADNPGCVVVEGNTLEIRKILKQMDQNGTGKGDLMVNDPPVNQTLGNIPAYPRNQEERIYTWNNTWTNGVTTVELQFNDSGFHMVVEGANYTNKGIGLPANTIPADVQAYYNAAKNGVAYTSEYTYPHPLVTP